MSLRGLQWLIVKIKCEFWMKTSIMYATGSTDSKTTSLQQFKEKYLFCPIIVEGQKKDALDFIVFISHLGS